MTETVKCGCGCKVEVNRERDVVICRACGEIVYKRITDYQRERTRTQLGIRKRQNER